MLNPDNPQTLDIEALAYLDRTMDEDALTLRLLKLDEQTEANVRDVLKRAILRAFKAGCAQGVVSIALASLSAAEKRRGT